MAQTKEIVDLIRILRAKCPWDRKRNLMDMTKLFVEESYELMDALKDNDKKKITEEIGDLLFLGLMTAVIAEDEIGLNQEKLNSQVITKYKERHPHVFGDVEVKDDNEVLKRWNKSKRKGPFTDIPKVLPALIRARLIQERASHYGFDWDSIKGPLQKVKEEVEELIESDEDKRELEFGDLLFSLVNLARFLKIEPETALKLTCDKFQRRFQKVLDQAGPDADLATMDKIWEQMKDD